MIELVLAFLKIGFLGFGGGYAMLSLIYAESKTFGLSLQQFADLNALDGMIPGPIAINSATYIGQLTHGFWGALLATLMVCVPSFVIVPLYMHFEKRIKSNWVLTSILDGIKPASAGLILSVAFTIMLGTVFNINAISAWAKANFNWSSLVVIVGVLILDLKYHINPIILIALAGVFGAIVYYL